MQGEYEQDESRADAIGEEAFVSRASPSPFGATIANHSATQRTLRTIATTLPLPAHPLISHSLGNNGSIRPFQSKGVYQKSDLVSSLGMEMGLSQ